MLGLRNSLCSRATRYGRRNARLSRRDATFSFVEPKNGNPARADAFQLRKRMIHPFLKMNDFGNFGHQHFLEMLHKIWQHFCMFILKKSNDFFANILRSGQPTSEARSGGQRQLHNCGARTDSGAAKSTPTRNACAETLDFENICFVCVNCLMF